MTETEKILKEREETYGDFSSVVTLTDELVDLVSNKKGFREIDKEIQFALFMILHKIARAVNGDIEYIDNYRDIAGYAELIVKHLKCKQIKKEPLTEEEIYEEYHGKPPEENKQNFRFDTGDIVRNILNGRVDTIKSIIETGYITVTGDYIPISNEKLYEIVYYE